MDRFLRAATMTAVSSYVCAAVRRHLSYCKRQHSGKRSIQFIEACTAFCLPAYCPMIQELYILCTFLYL